MLEQLHAHNKEISEVWEQCKQFKHAQATQSMLCLVFGEQSINDIREKAPTALSDDNLKEQWPVFIRTKVAKAAVTAPASGKPNEATDPAAAPAPAKKGKGKGNKGKPAPG